MWLCTNIFSSGSHVLQAWEIDDHRLEHVFLIFGLSTARGSPIFDWINARRLSEHIWYLDQVDLPFDDLSTSDTGDNKIV